MVLVSRHHFLTLRANCVTAVALLFAYQQHMGKTFESVGFSNAPLVLHHPRNFVSIVYSLCLATGRGRNFELFCIHENSHIRCRCNENPIVLGDNRLDH